MEHLCRKQLFQVNILYFLLRANFFLLQNSEIVHLTGKAISVLMVKCQVRKKAQVTVSLTQLFKGMLLFLENSCRSCLSSLGLRCLQIPLTFAAGSLGAFSYWGGQELQKCMPRRPGTKYSTIHTAGGFMSLSLIVMQVILFIVPCRSPSLDLVMAFGPHSTETREVWAWAYSTYWCLKCAVKANTTLYTAVKRYCSEKVSPTAVAQS